MKHWSYFVSNTVRENLPSIFFLGDYICQSIFSSPRTFGLVVRYHKAAIPCRGSLSRKSCCYPRVGFTHLSYPLSWLYVSAKELEKLCDGRTRLPLLPHRPLSPRPTPFHVIYGANKETFTALTKNQQEICVTFMLWNNIMWVCFRQCNVRYQY